MTAIFQLKFWNTFSKMKISVFLFKKSQKFVPYGVIDNKVSLVQVMAWHLTGNKPLSEPTMT